MSFLYGVLGTLLTLALFGLGVWVGWKLHGRFYRSKAPALTAEQKEEIDLQQAQQKEWRDMMNYNVETAYGMNKSIFEELGVEQT